MREMSTRTMQLRNVAMKASMEYLDSLKKDLLDYAEAFRKSLNYLLENGKTEDNWFCLSSVVVEENPMKVFFDKDTVKCALETLATLNADNAIDVIDHIYNMNYNFLLFNSFRRMKKLEFRISECVAAFQKL